MKCKKELKPLFAKEAERGRGESDITIFYLPFWLEYV